MIVLGIDPHTAKPYGWALVDSISGGLVSFGTGSLLEVQAVIAGHGPGLVAVEDQYMNRNYKVAKGLSWSAGKVMGIAEAAGVVHVTVNVATWKSKMHAQKGTHVAVVRQRFGVDASDDEASAILIAAYAAGLNHT